MDYQERANSISYILDSNMKEVLEHVEKVKGNLDFYKTLEEQEIESLKEKLLERDLFTYIAVSHVLDGLELNEAVIQRVNSKGERKTSQDRKTRSKMAYKTTTISKAKRKEIARHGAKTRLSRPSTQKQAERKKRKARNKRASLGIG